MFQLAPSSDARKASQSASEVERFRAPHRRLCRDQLRPAALSPKVEPLDQDEGRTRKISTKWRQKQQHDRLCSQFEDGYWPQSAGTEMHLGFNAFDFSSSPEAFYDEPKEPPEGVKAPLYEPEPRRCEILQEEQQELSVESKAPPSGQHEQQKQHMAEVAKQVTAMGFNSSSLWQRRFPGFGQPGGPIQQLPMYGQNSLWGAPAHYATYGDQCRALYYRPLFYM
ncbi:uncharacterized protein IUM83_04116 [Phytophthora cinnamomi]|uniref:uncharacterized protein n=1 Tax=Phytophthora cinnamomi TaxID=4785 RepID=UPI00355A4771|nr:hypothetical protein IUM83_04116 [Phytophthora cinnamomi]